MYVVHFVNTMQIYIYVFKCSTEYVLKHGKCCPVGFQKWKGQEDDKKCKNTQASIKTGGVFMEPRYEPSLDCGANNVHHQAALKYKMYISNIKGINKQCSSLYVYKWRA